MLRLGIPALAEEMLVLMVTWTDWWLTGHFFGDDGDATKTAMGLMGYVMWLIPSLFAAVAIGATALVARYVGASDRILAARTANQAVLVGGAIAAAMMVAAIALGGQFLELMQIEGRAAVYAGEYFEIVIWAIPFVMVSQVGSACLRGAGDTVTGFVAKLIVVIANILISTALVMGWAVIPKIGWQGLAIGTAVGHGIGGTIVLWVLIRGRGEIKLDLRYLVPDFSLIRKLLRIGVPGGFDVALLLFSQLMFLAIINSMGESAAAAHGLAVQIEALCFLPGAAFEVAAATMAGQFLGAKLVDRAKSSAWWCLLGGGVVMTLAGAILYFGGHSFAYFFTGSWSDPTTVNAAELLRIVALVMPALAVAMILTGTLRGAGDTVIPCIFTGMGFFLIRIPLAIYLGFDEIPIFSITDNPVIGWGLGVTGAWYAMAIDVVFRGSLILGRFLHGKWKNVTI
jgi:putative MATE family efflux protein